MDEEIRESFLAHVAENLSESTMKYVVQAALNGWNCRDRILMINENAKIITALRVIIEAVEHYSNNKKKLSGREKLDLASDYLFYLLDSPRIFEWQEVTVLEYLICSIVFSNNLQFGHQWKIKNEKTDH